MKKVTDCLDMHELGNLGCQLVFPVTEVCHLDFPAGLWLSYIGRPITHVYTTMSQPEHLEEVFSFLSEGFSFLFFSPS